MAAAHALAATAALNGRAILAPRLSEQDPRSRHRGLSHHTEAIATAAPHELAWPAGAPIDAPEGAEQVDVAGWREACDGLPLSHMGRGPNDDPWFFAAAFAAGRYAAGLVSPR